MTAVGSFASSPGPYGTYDMGGDVWQWTEELNAGNGSRIIAGGAWDGESVNLESYAIRAEGNPVNPSNDTGFRVAALPSAIRSPAASYCCSRPPSASPVYGPTVGAGRISQQRRANADATGGPAGR